MSKEVFKGNILEETAKTLKTQEEHIVKTITRFKSDLEKAKVNIK